MGGLKNQITGKPFFTILHLVVVVVGFQFQLAYLKNRPELGDETL